MTHHPRRIRLVRPGLQLRLIIVLAGMTALSLTLQYILFTSIVADAATGLPNDGLLMLDRVSDLLIAAFLASFGVLLPITFITGVLATHRFAGPIHRFESFLREVVAGEQVQPCELRKGDELGALCALINAATADRRASNEAAPPPAPREAEPQASDESAAA